jgi:uncharacterized protein
VIPELLVEWRPTEATRPFWKGLRAGELRLQRCRVCDRVQYPPSQLCRACGSRELSWMQSRGQGKLYSWTVVERALMPELRSQVPYVLGLVELDEGARLLALLRDCGNPAVGLRLDARYDVVVAEVVLPAFSPSPDAGRSTPA